MREDGGMAEKARVWSNTRSMQYVHLPATPPRPVSRALIARTCLACGELRMLSEYRLHGGNRQGQVAGKCRPCERKHRHALTKAKRKRAANPSLPRWALLIARTCKQCGELKERAAFDKGRWRCNACSWARGTSEASKERARTNTQAKRDVFKREAEARRSGLMWTGPEYEVAARTDLTTAEVATMLGRSLTAVSTMRSRMKVDPRKQAML